MSTGRYRKRRSTVLDGIDARSPSPRYTQYPEGDPEELELGGPRSPMVSNC